VEAVHAALARAVLAAPRAEAGGRTRRSPHTATTARPRRGRRGAGEIRTARSRAHAKQRPHKCGFGAVRAGREEAVNCPPAAARESRRRTTSRTRTTKQPLAHCPRCCSARALAFLTASASASLRLSATSLSSLYSTSTPPPPSLSQVTHPLPSSDPVPPLQYSLLLAPAPPPHHSRTTPPPPPPPPLPSSVSHC
jgi:hypothetical protein